MKDTFRAGAIARYETVVTEEMLPLLDGERVFPVVATASVLHVMEAASRRLMREHLDDHEEALGCAVSLEHLATCGVGKKLNATAELVEYRHHRARIHVAVFDEDRLIATGIHIQRVMHRDRALAAIDAGCSA